MYEKRKVELVNTTIIGVGVPGDIVELSEEDAQYYIGIGRAKDVPPDPTEPVTEDEIVQCHGKNKSGKRCARTAIKDSLYCKAHKDQAD